MIQKHGTLIENRPTSQAPIFSVIFCDFFFLCSCSVNVFLAQNAVNSCESFFFGVEMNKPHRQQKQVDIIEIVNISLLSFHICMRLRQQMKGIAE